jgi:hypothetical protein
MPPILDLIQRLRRPQRIGVFGHRGVGKTTLLAVLYREAVAGRRPGLRLAAADARTADYLADKILQLEAGQVLPATLAETELRLHLYHAGNRLELLVKDYQGEHIELGRAEPIREFLRDCDAVWLCLDLGTLASAEDRLRRQQEVEQFFEDVLATEVSTTVGRPVALVLTKADLREGPLPERLAMSRHALQTHCQTCPEFAVSSLTALRRRQKAEDRRQKAEDTGQKEEGCLLPSAEDGGLTEPLAWLATALLAQDEARLGRVWAESGGRVGVLAEALAAFARRYPEAPATAKYRHRLRDLRRHRARRRGVLAAAAAACLTAALAAYDAFGYRQAARFEADNPANPAAILRQWQSYQAWHPTRHLFRVSSARAEEDRLRDLAERARCQERDEFLAELRRRAADADADPEAVWQQFHEFRSRYPEVSVTGDLERLRADLKARRDAHRDRRARQAHDDLAGAVGRGTDPAVLVAQADRFLRDFAGTSPEAAVRRLRAAALRRLDERDIETARQYSAGQPLHFLTRREQYQRYLDRHPDGAFVAEAEAALTAIDADWDKNDFRTVRDHFVSRPGDVDELVARCRTYLAAHPRGRFAASARELLRWSEMVTGLAEYRVVLRSGQFEKNVARFFSRGPDLSVQLEVAGVRYGPSPIVRNRYDPEWEYEFPRRVRWKLGDPVRIRVTDHDWWDRVVVDVSSADGDALAMRLLAGEAWSGGNRLTFASDFALPTLPPIE